MSDLSRLLLQLADEAYEQDLVSNVIESFSGIAVSLKSIAASLEKIANPPIAVESEGWDAYSRARIQQEKEGSSDAPELPRYREE